jgi:hypothetical protein
MPRFRPYRPDDYSPRDVARLRLLGFSSHVAIYARINRGEIETVQNEFGEKRITKTEIVKLQKEWKIKPPKTPQMLLLEQAEARERRKAGGYGKAARHTKEELHAPMAAGTRKAIIRKIDPEGKYSGDELERRIAEEEKKRMALVRRGNILKQMRELQYNSDPA